MKIASLPKEETARLDALMNYKILDTGFEEIYDELTQLASDICQTPIALISLIDVDRQWFKAKVGLEVRETPRDWAFCAHALLQDDILVVEDTLLDERFVDNPLVVNDPCIRFYAGAQIKTSDGYVLGTVCTIDRVPRHLSTTQLNALKVLAKQVMSQFELRVAFEELQKQTQRLHELNLTKDKLFSIISHDLRAPLSGILGASELLIEDIGVRSTEECKDLVQDIHQTSQHTLTLLDNLLRWALLERGKCDYRPIPLLMMTLIQSVLRVLNSVFAQKSVHITVDCPSQLMVIGDKTMLTSTLQNLLSNAIKFTEQGGKVVVKVELINSEQVSVKVVDSGIGMNNDQLNQLFFIEKNISTHGTKGETGSGLGLILSSQFLKIHGSDLKVISTLGQGTEFSFVLKKA